MSSATYISEPTRLREVRKYYYRGNVHDSATGTVKDNLGIAGATDGAKVTSPNRTLTSLMQLVACRLNMQHAIVSIVDENAQYFLAEATRTLNLVDPTIHESGDSLWLGCGGTSRSEALCANTIEVPLEPNRPYACFYVTDLSQDPRFCNLPYVSGEPRFRYYAGTPLLSSANIPIGSVYVIDDRARGPPTAEEVELLGLTACNVMEYLEMKRLSETRKRIETMSKGLAAFVDGKCTILPELKSDAEDGGHDRLSRKEDIHTRRNSHGAHTYIPSSKEIRHGVARFSSLDESSSSEVAGSLPVLAEDSQFIPTPLGIYSRAANLLRESLTVDATIFLDATVAPTADAIELVQGDYGVFSEDDNSSTHSVTSKAQHPTTFSQDGAHIMSESDSEDDGLSLKENNKSSEAARTVPKPPTRARILSFASLGSVSINDSHENQEHSLYVPDYKRLRRLLKRYTEGKIWTFDDKGSDSSDENNSSFDLNRTQNNKQSTKTKRSETILLTGCFPGARQVLFAPLIDLEKGTQFAAVFCVSFHPMPVFTTSIEVGFLRAFLNNVSVSISLASVAAANRQKGDFISSISHELRSPLHGILASTELLTSSALDRRQKEFCDAISTCGKSLLETITSILEYTKINTLRKHSRRPKSLSKDLGLVGQCIPENGAAQHTIRESLALSSIEKDCEDAVIVVAAAYMHHASNPHQPLYRVFVPSDESSGHYTNENDKSYWPSVTVILDMMYCDWKFDCLPGSFQRIVMNLVGNSLKYTQSGYVKVELTVEKASQDVNELQNDHDSIAVLKVIDSGRGISLEFLQNSLYMPFSQESTLSPGTGLGLHIVKSLVSLLKGTIDIRSEANKGTTVTVKLPLRRNTTEPGTSNESTSPSEVDRLVAAVRKSDLLKSYAFYGFSAPIVGPAKASLHCYLTDWLGMSNTSDIGSANLAVVTEDGLPTYLSSISPTATISAHKDKQKVIVVCDQTRQKHIFETYNSIDTPIELLTIPFGPIKVSKTILACLESVEQTTMTTTDALDALQNTPNEGYSGVTPTAPWPTTESVSSSNECVEPVAAPIATIINLPIRPAEMRQSTKHNPRILCVDDNAINLRIIKAFLEKLDFHDITSVVDGGVAYEAVRFDRKGFDLIFMDLSMPVCDGFESISLIRSLERVQQKITPSTCAKPRVALIVALTGLASQRDRDAAKTAGSDHYLTKPLKLAKLKEVMTDWGYIE
ncbi:M4GK, histidine kinase-group I protein [Calycina marina]|uniref:histidine kinase n=1 Tax=Calycina marina TaxID=1763456 RepID=A0A9P8CJF4_9HELO|nr:M4GK, histidine kinase-group I protein [Calycina marina]